MKEEKKKYRDWIKALADYQGGREHFSDQTVESLRVLAQLIKLYEPDTIMELGTAHGLSTRLWLDEAKPETKIVCVDAGFTPLLGTAEILPLDIDRLELVEGWVRKTRLQDYWEGRTLLYLDIHSDHKHVMDAIPDLPNGSAVVFDDVWRSGKKLVTEEDRETFLKKVVEPQIDYTAPKAIWPLCYGDYWRRGGFWGFGEVPLLMNWVRENKITLHWEIGAKVVWFPWN